MKESSITLPWYANPYPSICGVASKDPTLQLVCIVVHPCNNGIRGNPNFTLCQLLLLPQILLKFHCETAKCISCLNVWNKIIICMCQ